MTGKNSYI